MDCDFLVRTDSITLHPERHRERRRERRREHGTITDPTPQLADVIGGPIRAYDEVLGLEKSCAKPSSPPQTTRIEPHDAIVAFAVVFLTTNLTTGWLRTTWHISLQTSLQTSRYCCGVCHTGKMSRRDTYRWKRGRLRVIKKDSLMQNNWSDQRRACYSLHTPSSPLRAPIPAPSPPELLQPHRKVPASSAISNISSSSMP